MRQVQSSTLKDFARTVLSHETNSILNLMSYVNSMVVSNSPSYSVSSKLFNLRAKLTPIKYIRLKVIKFLWQTFKSSKQKLVEMQVQSNYLQEIKKISVNQKNLTPVKALKHSIRPSIFLVLENVLKVTYPPLYSL